MGIYDIDGNMLHLAVSGSTSLDIQNAIDSVFEAGGGIVELDGSKTYTISNQIVLYSDFVSLVGNGAKLDGSGSNPTSVIKIIGSTSLPNESEQIRQQYLHFIEGIYFIGSNRTPDYTGTRSGTAIICAGTSTDQISNGFLIKNCAIAGFHIGVDFQSQAWCNTLFNCDISVCDIGVRVASGNSNYGEKLSVLGGCLHANSLALSMNHIYGTFQCVDAAFDYNWSVADCAKGHIYMSNCHLESTKNKDYWLKSTGGKILVRDSVFYGQQNTYGLVSMTSGGIYLRDNSKETWNMATNSISGGTFEESWI